MNQSTAQLVASVLQVSKIEAEKAGSLFPSACGTLTVGRLRELLAGLEDTAEIAVTTAGLPAGIGRLTAASAGSEPELIGYAPAQTAASERTAGRRGEMDAARRVASRWPLSRREVITLRRPSVPAA